MFCLSLQLEDEAIKEQLPFKVSMNYGCHFRFFSFSFAMTCLGVNACNGHPFGLGLGRTRSTFVVLVLTKGDAHTYFHR